MFKVLWCAEQSFQPPTIRSPGGSSIHSFITVDTFTTAMDILGRDRGIIALVVGKKPNPSEAIKLGNAVRGCREPVQVIIAYEGSTGNEEIVSALGPLDKQMVNLDGFTGPAPLYDYWTLTIDAIVERAKFRRIRFKAIDFYSFGGQSDDAIRLSLDIMAASESRESRRILGVRGAGHEDLARLTGCLDPLRGSDFLIVYNKKKLLEKPSVQTILDDWARLLSDNPFSTLFVEGIPSLSPDIQGPLLEAVRRGPELVHGNFSFREVRILFSEVLESGKKSRRISAADSTVAFDGPTILMQPLATRPGDITPVAKSWIRKIWDACGAKVPFPDFTSETFDLLQSIDWPYDREGLLHFLEWYILIAGYGAKEPIRPSGMTEELNAWLSAATVSRPKRESLKGMQFARAVGIDHDFIMSEALYAYIAIERRRLNRHELAETVDRSTRWVEMRIRELVRQNLRTTTRSVEVLKRDRIWSRRLKG